MAEPTPSVEADNKAQVETKILHFSHRVQELMVRLKALDGQ